MIDENSHIKKLEQSSTAASDTDFSLDDTIMTEEETNGSLSWISSFSNRFPFLPHGLLGRSLLIIVTPLILVQIVTTYVFFDRHWGTLSRRLSDGLIGDVRALASLMEQYPDQRDYFQHATAGIMHLHMWFEPKKQLPNKQSTYSDTYLGNLLGSRMESQLPYKFALTLNILDRDAILDVQLKDGVMHVIAPRERLFSSALYLFLLWMIGTSLVLFAVATLFMRNQVRAVRRLANAANRLGKGQDDVPNFKPEGATEVRQAAAAFIRMRARIRRQVSERTTMLAGVSHDLRTPLTRMRLQLALLGKGLETEGLIADITDMELMIDGYLSFARGERSETSKPTDLALLLKDLTRAIRHSDPRSISNPDTDIISKQSEPELHTSIQKLPILSLRAHAMQRCITNLMTNAQRYARHKIILNAASVKDHVEILIDDDGPGIPKEKHHFVFRPFSRLDESRNSETGGVGLGLTIARDVARSHGGDISLSESPLGGLRVCVRLPV